MATPVDFWGYWYLHVPNYVLAALMYTLLGRFLLSFAFAPGHPNYIFRAFEQLTDWFVGLVRFVTPAVVPHMLLLILAAVWALALRFVLYVGLGWLGLLPRIQG